MLWYVWNLLVPVLHFLIFWSQYQSGSSFGYLSNRIGVSNHFLKYYLSWLIVNLEETVRTAAISTVVSGNMYPNGTIDSTPSLNSPQMIYSIPEIYKTYWVRTNGYWVSVTRSRQEAVWVLFHSSNVHCMPLTGKWCIIVGCIRMLKWNTSCTFGKEDFIFIQLSNLSINTITFLSRIMTIKDAKVLYDLIDEARKIYMETQGKRVRIFTVEELSCSSLSTGSY